MSRIFDALRRAEERRAPSRVASAVPPTAEHTPAAVPAHAVRERRWQMLAVCNSKGGVGKSTLSTNLAVYLRALDEARPILLLNLDDQRLADRMFTLNPQAAFAGPRAAPTMTEALRRGSFDGAIQLGQYGIHYVATGTDIAVLKREFDDPSFLAAALDATDWEGLVIVDTKGDLELLTQSALAAADLALVPVRDEASLLEARRVFSLLASRGRDRDVARIVLSMIDLRVKYAGARGEVRDLLSLLTEAIRRDGFPLSPNFVSQTPKIEALTTNPSGAARTILHSASGSVVHRQLLRLAQEVREELLVRAVLAKGRASRRPVARRSALERGVA